MQFSECLPTIVTGGGLTFVFFAIRAMFQGGSTRTESPWGVYNLHTVTRTGDVFMLVEVGAKRVQRMFHHGPIPDDFSEEVPECWSEETTGWQPDSDEQTLLTGMYVAARARELEAKATST